MPAYEVLLDCATGETGQLTKGTTVELDEAQAEMLNAGAAKCVALKTPATAKPKDA